jgi:hypothetical protein
VVVAAVQLRRDGAVLGAVLGDVGVEQVQRRTSGRVKKSFSG